MKAHLTQRALREMRHIDAWWREYRPEAPDLFRDELLAALRILVTAPNSGAPHGSFRRRLVRRVPLLATRHQIYYLVTEERVEVLAIWGAPKRNPPRFGP